MTLDDKQLGDLVRTLVRTEDVELNCEDCLATVAAYAESELSGKTPTEALQRVEQHLTVCADCQEEYRALLEVIRGIR